MYGEFTNKIGKDLLELYINGPSHNNLLKNDEDDDEPVSIAQLLNKKDYI